MIPIVVIGGVILYILMMWGWWETIKPLDSGKWYGAMRCGSCSYQWQSRRKTPPAACP